MIATTTVISDVPPVIAAPSRTRALLYRALIFPLKLVWGMLLCQSFLGSILVVGWTYRLAQRAALKFWWSRRPSSERGITLDQFLIASERTEPHQHWPNWFLRQNFRESIRQPERRAPALRDPTSEVSQSCRSTPGLPFALVHSLWQNFWIGLRAITNTWVLTLPACLFWWFGWYDGWNNSFNKGYEQAPVGPLISIFGIVLFIAAMFYLPLAQARQAVTGEWRSFYQFRLVWKIVRDRSVYCVLLGVLYTLLSIPLSILKTSPMFWMHNSPALSAMTSSQVTASLKGYFFWCA